MSDFIDIEGTIIPCPETATARVTITFEHYFTEDKYGEFDLSEDAFIALITKALKAEGIHDAEFEIEY